MQIDELINSLRQGIREGVLLPGQALVQEELAKRFNVSRIPVRDALMKLAAEGLVTSRPGGGLAVSQLTAQEVQELYDLRISIEPGLSEHIVHNASPRALAEWRAMANELRGADSTAPSWVELNYRFHLSLYAVTEREHTLRIIRALLDMTTPYARLFMASLHDQASVHDDHDEMIAAIQARDVEALRQTIAEHLAVTQQSVFGFLNDLESHPSASRL